MKVCFIGLGSIGKRHLRNITKLSKEYNLKLDIHALRKTNNILEQDIQNLVNYEVMDESELDNDYDIAFITNPTSLHYDTIKFMVDKTKHMFIEKPVFDNKDYNVNDLGLNEEGIYYVAGPLRFSTVIQELKKILINEQIYSIRAICSSYLPDWRPGSDYRNVYSAKKEEGGGVSIDLIHEWDYITHLFGFPHQVSNFQGKYSHLEIDSEDLSVYIGQYEDKLVEVHLDYFGRVKKREIEIYTMNGTIIGDFIKNMIHFVDGRTALDFSNNGKDMYIEEMRSFLEKVIYSEKGENNIQHAYNVLKLATGGR